MQNPFKLIYRRLRGSLIFLLVGVSILLVTIIIPKHSRFRYEYEAGRPWMHDDFVSPFAFAIHKAPEEIKKEQKEIIDHFSPYYDRNTAAINGAKAKFTQLIDRQLMLDHSITMEEKNLALQRGLHFLESVFDKGIIQLDKNHQSKSTDFIITEIKNNVSTERALGSYLSLKEVKDLARDSLKTNAGQAWITEAIAASADNNITYDKVLSDKKLSELMDNVSPNKGMIHQGETIITQGSTVTQERLLVLNSLKEEYEGSNTHNKLIWAGYLLLVASLFIIYGFFLWVFQRELFASARSGILILIQILGFTALTAFIIQQPNISIYAIPYAMVPVILLALLELRVAVLTHILIVLLCGLIVPNPFEFILLQIISGFVAILSIARIRYISQFFIAALLVLLAYIVVYFGLDLIKSETINDIAWSNFLWFGVNFVLMLLSYPLIYANEKIFGFLSDIRLLELADINNKALRELFTKAPGTFQHSLQVANLSESITNRIGGNALLARVGALYHDIGKVKKPEYYTENQRPDINPHDKLTELQSAELIISHVADGVAIAHKNHLPKKVIDFIRTHHGTTRTEYFYSKYKQAHPEEAVDDTPFRYPGPKPNSKETAVVMMVDSVEAASKSLKDPDEKQIDALVDKIIDGKIKDDQFYFASITLQEINTARQLLKKLLKSVMHARVEYPGTTEEKKIF